MLKSSFFEEKKSNGRDCRVRKKFKNIDFGLSGSIFFLLHYFSSFSLLYTAYFGRFAKGKNHNSMNKKKDQMLWF